MKKDDLQETRFAESETPELDDGQALLGVDSFGLTTNNITYAVMGEGIESLLNFPGRRRLGPHAGLGLCGRGRVQGRGVRRERGSTGTCRPPATSSSGRTGLAAPDFVDVSPHRVDLPAAYNRYLRTDGNEMYEKENEDYEILRLADAGPWEHLDH